jgi:transposase
MQCVEGLPDRQAADAVRSRIGWKYALGLELSDSGFHFSILCEFRARLIEGHLERLLFEKMLTYLKEQGLIKAGGRQRTDATHVLAAVRATNRVVCAGEAMRAALNSLASASTHYPRRDEPGRKRGCRCDATHSSSSQARSIAAQRTSD